MSDPQPNFDIISERVKFLQDTVTGAFKTLDDKITTLTTTQNAMRETMAKLEERTSGIKESRASSEVTTWKWLGIIGALVGAAVAIYSAFRK